jgi:hypothetical protein
MDLMEIDSQTAAVATALDAVAAACSLPRTPPVQTGDRPSMSSEEPRHKRKSAESQRLDVNNCKGLRSVTGSATAAVESDPETVESDAHQVIARPFGVTNWGIRRASEQQSLQVLPEKFRSYCSHNQHYGKWRRLKTMRVGEIASVALDLKEQAPTDASLSTHLRETEQVLLQQLRDMGISTARVKKNAVVIKLLRSPPHAGSQILHTDVQKRKCRSSSRGHHTEKQRDLCATPALYISVKAKALMRPPCRL